MVRPGRLWSRLPLLRSLHRPGFVAGLLAALPYLLLTLLLRLMGLGVFLPEVAVEAVVATVPGALESFLIHNLGEGAKLLGLAIAVVVVILAHGFVGAFYPVVQGRLRNRYAVMVVFIFLPWALAVFVALPLLGAGVAGVTSAQGPVVAPFGLFLGYAIFAAVLDYLNVDYPKTHPGGLDLSRRGFLKLGAVLAVGAAITAVGLGRLALAKARESFRDLQDLLAHEVTPNDEFYIVSKNLIDPTVDVTAWRLTLGGLVTSPRVWTYDDLQAMVDADEYATLECVSNEVGGDLISTARWQGIPLGELLRNAAPTADARWVVFSCADGYTVAIPMERALDPATLVALRMNGDPLPQRHGFPARIVVPGRYGMFHAKWVTGIDLVASEVQGYWQQKGWTNEGEVRTTAIITTPEADSLTAPPVTIAGVAFAGNRGISRVEVSTDGGQTWQDAALREPLSAYTWRLWSYPWTPPANGSYRIMARAYDGTGQAQDPTVATPFPQGSSGYDAVRIVVG